MKKNIPYLIILFVLVSFVFPSNVYGNSLIKDYLDVRVGSSLSTSDYVNLYSENGFYLYEKSDKNNVIFEIDDDAIIISPNRSGDVEILDTDHSLIETIPGDGSIIIGSGDLDNSLVKVEKNRYRDYITFLIRGDVFSVINHVHMENYLYGVVPREMGPSFHPEALKAQAVAARSFAMANINKHKGEGFNLCDRTDCQVYGAYDNEKPETNSAVDETRGIYAFYDGKVATTIFHATSGGYTEDSSKVWGGTLPYLSAVKDDFSSNTPYSNWSIKLTPREINEKLILAGINVGEVVDIQVSEVSDANRALKVKIVGTLGETTISGNTLRNILGTTSLKSTWFSVLKNGTSSNSTVYVLDGSSFYPVAINLDNAHIIDGRNERAVTRGRVSRAISSNRIAQFGNTYTSEPASFVIEGRGYGHGVGMSQYGAGEMAKLGYNFEEILKHYYTGIDIVKIYDN